MENKKKVGVGVGIAAAVAAAAAAYMLTGERGKKNRAAIKGAVDKAKKEIEREVKKAKNVTKKQYHSIVDQVLAKYKQIDKAAVVSIVSEMKNHWDVISDEVKGATKTVKKAPKKVVKKKKTVKKS